MRKLGMLVGLATLVGLTACGPKQTETAASPMPGMSAEEHAKMAPAPAEAQPAATAEAEASQVTNQLCPVMKGKVNPKISIEHEGQKVYFCCAGCPEKFKQDPAKYQAALKQPAEDAASGTDVHGEAGHDPHAGHGG